MREGSWRRNFWNPEILWGADHRSHYATLTNLEAELYGAIIEHLDSVDPSPDETTREPARVAARRAILYERAERTDELSYMTSVAVGAVEFVLRPYLGR